MNTGDKVGALEREWECWEESGNVEGEGDNAKERVSALRRWEYWGDDGNDGDGKGVAMSGREWQCWGKADNSVQRLAMPRRRWQRVWTLYCCPQGHGSPPPPPCLWLGVLGMVLPQHHPSFSSSCSPSPPPPPLLLQPKCLAPVVRNEADPAESSGNTSASHHLSLAYLSLSSKS